MFFSLYTLVSILKENLCDCDLISTYCTIIQYRYHKKKADNDRYQSMVKLFPGPTFSPLVSQKQITTYTYMY